MDNTLLSSRSYLFLNVEYKAVGRMRAVAVMIINEDRASASYVEFRDSLAISSAVLRWTAGGLTMDAVKTEAW
jgi:hypothetical protein